MSNATRSPVDLENPLENPFLFCTNAEIQKLFGFGENAISQMRALGAPVVANKINPKMLMRWLEAHWQEVGKIGA